MLKIYGIEHILYLVIVITMLSMLMVLLKFKIKSDKSQRLMFMILGIIDIISVLINRIALSIESNNYFMLIPDSFCGMSGLVLGIGLAFFKKNNIVLHAVWFIAFLGMVITLAHPDFITKSDSLFYFPTITSLWHHTVTLFNLIAIFLFKYISLNYKKAWVQIPGTIIYIGIGFFLVFVGNVHEAYYLYVPAVKGTFLYFHYMYPMYLAVYALIFFGVELYRKKHKEKDGVISEA